jgi:hypothetical protein
MGQWAEAMTIEFTVPDAVLIDDAEQSAETGIPFTIGGTYAPLCELRYTVPSGTSNLSWTLDGVYTFSLAGSVAVGELVIDFVRKTATIGGVSKISQIPLAQDIPDIGIGNHTLTGEGMIYWHERWV